MLPFLNIGLIKVDFGWQGSCLTLLSIRGKDHKRGWWVWRQLLIFHKLHVPVDT